MEGTRQPPVPGATSSQATAAWEGHVDNQEEFLKLVHTKPNECYQTWVNFEPSLTEIDNLRTQLSQLQGYQGTLADENQEYRSTIAGLQSQVQMLRIQVEELQNMPATTPSTPRNTLPTSKKVPEPDTFDGDREKFDDWKMQVALKLRGNSDWYPTEDAKLVYVLSLLRGSAQDQMRAYVDEHGNISIPDYPAFLSILEAAFGNPDRKGTAQNKLRELRQKGRDFSSFYAEFSRLVVQTGYNDEAKKATLLSALSSELTNALISHDVEPMTLQQLVTLCQRLDIRMQQAAAHNSNRRAPRIQPAFATPYAPSPKPATAPIVAPSTPVSAPHLESTTPMDLGTARTKRGPLTDNEKERRRAQGLCLYCGQNGHIAVNCPSKPQARLGIHTTAFGFRQPSEPNTPTPQPQGNALSL